VPFSFSFLSNKENLYLLVQCLSTALFTPFVLDQRMFHVKHIWVDFVFECLVDNPAISSIWIGFIK